MDPLPIASELVAVPSVSSQSNHPVADVTAAWMTRSGFQIERLEFVDPHGTPHVNLVGKKGKGTGGLAYFGHNDVVPVDTWSFPSSGPFESTVHNKRLYGRGSCDMKGSVAAFLAAAGRMPADELTAPIYFICTADEEIGHIGAQDVARRSQLYRELIAQGALGIIGEPTELEVVYAHKGAVSFRVTSHGRAAHSSTREGRNANWAMIPFLVEIERIRAETESDPAWNHPEFDPSDLRFNLLITDHSPALNITASESVCRVGFRPMPGQKYEQLIDRARAAAAKCGLEFVLGWNEPPVRTDPNSDFVREVLRIAGKSEAHTVSYGTDGSSFLDVKQVVVLGPGDIRQAHTDDEWIALDQLRGGADLYEKLIRRWCS
jgi:acetylornithine deacetylase